MQFRAVQVDMHQALIQIMHAGCHVFSMRRKVVTWPGTVKARSPVIQHNAVRVAALCVHPVFAPVLAVVSEDQAWAVLVVSHVTKLTVTAGSHQASHTFAQHRLMMSCGAASTGKNMGYNNAAGFPIKRTS